MQTIDRLSRFVIKGPKCYFLSTIVVLPISTDIIIVCILEHTVYDSLSVQVGRLPYGDCLHVAILKESSALYERKEGKYYKEVTRKRVQTAAAGLVWSPFMSHGLLIVLFTVL